MSDFPGLKHDPLADALEELIESWRRDKHSPVDNKDQGAKIPRQNTFPCFVPAI